MRRFLGKAKLLRQAEALAILCVAVALATLFNAVNAFDHFADFIQRYEAWQLDEYFFAFAFCGMGALIIAIRRATDLTREIDKRQKAESRAATLARRDPLTGLANRRLLQEELPRLLDLAASAGEQAAVLVIDLDHFKPINDVHGHEVGDAALIEVAARLRACCPEWLTARTGGDEFVVALADASGGEAPSRLAGTIIRALCEPYWIDGRRVDLGASIGIARFPDDSTEADELLRAADVAMYDAKRAGKGRHRFFHAEMDARIRARAELESDLRGAIERGEVVPYFQPVISLGDNRILGFEALARWDHPTRGLIPPDEFVPIAEDNGLIDSLSTRILRASCLAARDWHPETTLSVNISPIQLRDSWLAVRLLAILTETGFSARRLIVEVTENAIIEDVEQASAVFASLQAAGIRIALDDFGKGYSSLSHLRQLRFDHLKIDSSFVQTMGSRESKKIIRAVAGLGRALGMPVTAEGVETLEAANTLRALGCEQAQGYLFGAPTPARGATDRLDAEHARATLSRVN